MSSLRILVRRAAFAATLLTCSSWLSAASTPQSAPAASTTPAAAAVAVPNPPRLRDCPDCPEMVIVPPGQFDMGSNDGEKTRPEGPIHRVTLARAFALGRTEVTVAEFRRFIAATGHKVPPGCRVQETAIGPRGRVEWRDDPSKGWSDPGFSEPLRDDMPVVCIGHDDAEAYARWLASATGKPYRLPSEAEWEYAARAGSTTPFPWGSNSDNGCPHANLYDRSGRQHLDFGWSFVDCDDGFRELAPVGQFLPNAFGLYDMIGNAWEWTADCHREFYDPSFDDGGVVPPPPDCQRWTVRGGGWMTRPSRQRVTFRGRDPKATHYSYFGFRVARDLVNGETGH
ncbi:MAG: formylglycine-generating enzyme family protein [Sinobacteraceae bacterium]|nr:formylglycine-generating enzyme family protein [Nevskiaceae bacterium]